MQKNKKGAIELSMTTIIVIIIGVTLLTLGITFVRTIFTKISDISTSTFDEAQDLLSEIENVNKFLTVNPNIKSIESGGDGVIKVTIANFEQEAINVDAIANTADENLRCEFLTEEGSFKPKTGTMIIASGSQERLALVIKDTGKGGLRTTGCTVTVNGAPTTEDNSDGVVIKIVKG